MELRGITLYQLLGYVLLDYEDEFEIGEVGLYMSRQALIATWPLSELLPRLCDASAVDLGSLRNQFRALLEELASTSVQNPPP